MKPIKPNIQPFSHIALAMQMARENENLTFTPYHDTVGKLTIGFGRNLEDKGISHSESELLLANDVTVTHAMLLSEFGFYKSLSEVRQAVLMDMLHNMGMGGLKKFKKMLHACRVGDWDEAGRQMQDSQYWKQVGVRAKRNYLMLRFDKYFTRAEAESYFINQNE